MLTIQSFLDRWHDSIGKGNRWLQSQHPVTVSSDIVAAKLAAHEQVLDDVFLYNHSKTKRYHTRISDECNGLILDKQCNVVSKAFNRTHDIDAYNAADLDWDHTIVECDYDGKIVVFFNHLDKWFIQTIDSVHAGDVMTIPSTGRSVSCRTLIKEFIRDNMRVESLDELLKVAMKNACFVCIYKHPEIHLCGPDGKEELLLLGVIDKTTSTKYSTRHMFPAYVDDLADTLGFDRPMQLEASGKEASLSCINRLESWQRGIVIQDVDHKRVKIRNPKFKPINRILKAGREFTKKQLISMFLTGSADEVIKLEPGYNEPLRIFNKMIDVRISLCKNAWDKAKEASCQKEFAACVNHSLLNYVLFHARKFGPLNRTEFIQKIKPDLAEQFIGNIGEADAFERALEKARS